MIAGPRTTTSPDLDRTPPAVTRTAPVGNDQALEASSGTLDPAVTATNDTRVDTVLFRRWDDASQSWLDLNSDNISPFTGRLDVAGLSVGDNGIHAYASVPAGNWGNATIWITRPQGPPPPVVPLPSASCVVPPHHPKTH